MAGSALGPHWLGSGCGEGHMWGCVGGCPYLLPAHPAVHLLTVTVEKMQVQALPVLLLPFLPQLQQSCPITGKIKHLYRGRDIRGCLADSSLILLFFA